MRTKFDRTNHASRIVTSNLNLDSVSLTSNNALGDIENMRNGYGSIATNLETVYTNGGSTKRALDEKLHTILVPLLRHINTLTIHSSAIGIGWLKQFKNILRQRWQTRCKAYNGRNNLFHGCKNKAFFCTDQTKTKEKGN